MAAEPEAIRVAEVPATEGGGREGEFHQLNKQLRACRRCRLVKTEKQASCSWQQVAQQAAAAAPGLTGAYPLRSSGEGDATTAPTLTPASTRGRACTN